MDSRQRHSGMTSVRELMKSLIRFSVNNSLFVNLMSVFMVVAGILALMNMSREAFPNISYDLVTIRTDYFGAPAQEIEKLISIKIEDELKEIDGIDELTSVSTENISLIIIKLDPDHEDKPKVVNDIQRAVDRVNDLPDDLEDDPIVTEVESKNYPVINVSVSGDFSEHELQKIAKVLETRILDIQEVAKVSRIGWRDREIWVEVDPELVDDYRLSLEEVISALKTRNLNLPGGSLDTALRGEVLVRTVGEFEDPKEIENVIIRANDVGNWIRVKDVAEVKDTFEDDDLLEKTRGQQTITLTVIKKQSADIIEVVNKVKAEAEAFQLQAPEGVEISYFDDLSYYVKRRLNVLVNNGKIGIVLVLFSLLFFLSRSVASMTALGIPIAIAFTFLLMSFMGLSINLITMFTLIMVMGIIVDDSIVIAENVYRHLQWGYSPKEAAIKGASEVAVPVLCTVLTTIAAFFPILFMTGMMGKFCYEIPFVVVAALGASLIECIFVLPSHLADFSRKSKNHGREAKRKGWFNRGFQHFRIFYLRVLRWVVHHRYKAIVVVIAVFVSGVMLFQFHMKFILFPEGLIEEFFVRAKAPIGTSLEDNEQRMVKIEEAVKQLREGELENFVTQIGLTQDEPSDPYASRGTNLAQVHVYLTPDKDRERKADEIIEEIRTKVEPYVMEASSDETNPNLLFEEITFEKVRAGPPVGKPVNIRIRGDDFDELERVAELYKQKLSEITGVYDIRDDFDPGKNEIRVVVDGEEAKRNFISVRDIAFTIKNAIDGGVATTIQKTDEEIDVVVRYPESYLNAEGVFDRLFVPNENGKLIALNKVSKLEEVPGIHAIKRFDRKRLIQVTALLNEDQITPIEVKSKIEVYSTEQIEKQYPNVAISFGGEQEETQEALGDFFKAMIMALFLIFIILACMFNSVVQPLVVMIAIPFGVLGVIFAFYLHGQPLSFMALLGLIGLSGVVVNDSIVLVDFINRHRRRGWSRATSIFQAGRLRIRPVILTSITTVLGLTPVAYGIGGSDPFVKPMALAIGWGLLFATFLTLLIIPCIYTIFDDIQGAISSGAKKAQSAFSR